MISLTCVSFEDLPENDLTRVITLRDDADQLCVLDNQQRQNNQTPTAASTAAPASMGCPTGQYCLCVFKPSASGHAVQSVNEFFRRVYHGRKPPPVLALRPKSIVSGLTDLYSKLSENRSKFHDRIVVTLTPPTPSVNPKP